MRISDFQVGWAVVGNDGHRLGTIKDLGHDYILVSTSKFGADLWVPVSSIANVEHEIIHLNLRRDDALEMGWEQVPRDDDPDIGADDLHRHI